MSDARQEAALGSGARRPVKGKKTKAKAACRACLLLKFGAEDAGTKDGALSGCAWLPDDVSTFGTTHDSGDRYHSAENSVNRFCRRRTGRRHGRRHFRHRELMCEIGSLHRHRIETAIKHQW